ncbi:putative sporulation protein YtxC [Schnuerera sp.]|uniref:putative sporulation protein YtxC n=1 Tax=Schnuerera sp. TaxID=2794844 RepID=UPI002D0C3CAD|nr:putative sporulation protein YtxC [Schnuerera sp.]HSH35277.1 putative sporulation protein YtxC [Schnuerera sp.]
MKVQIALNKDKDKARKIINNYLSNKKVKIEEIDYQTRYLFNITPVKNRSLKEFYNNIAKIILDLILNIYSKDIIYKQIKTNFRNLKTNEKKKVIEITKELLLNEENFTVEKEYINSQIKNYIMDMSFISIDGFILFRLKGFNLFINLVIDKGVEEFTLEKEYREFIKILQYFVEAQEPKYHLVNIVFEGKNYRLLDKDNKKIDNNFFDEVIAELDNVNISEDDLLISSLIVISPENIVIHLDEENKERDVIKIITDVFQNKVYFCLGCEKCKGKVKIKQD